MNLYCSVLSCEQHGALYPCLEHHFGRGEGGRAERGGGERGVVGIYRMEMGAQ